MERKVAKFSSHREAEEATLRYYRSLTPQQRMDILFALIDASRNERDDPERIERVYSIRRLCSDDRRCDR
ncbi:MAG TPA: hypothetical protein VJN43_21175 [Bryobacteraceae bacterium]|nr:hypothetical protein [Bryobacteraceae bacterium]